MKDTEKTGQGRIEYEPELVKYEVLEVCDYYLRERRKEGRRYTYRCPECGGRRFEVEPVRAMAGCFNAECELPKTTDAIGIIGYMEDLDTRGAGFIECLKKGYEILGLDPGGPEFSGGAGRPGPKARSWIAGEAATGEGDNLSSWEPGHEQGLEAPSGRLIEAYTELPDGSRQPLEAFVIEEDTGETFVASSGPGQVEEPSTPPISRVSGLPARRTARNEAFTEATPKDDRRETNHRVYERLLAMCPLEDRDREFLKGRGLDETTIDEGRFGSISKRRSRYVTERLDKRFDNEELLSVPGFYRADSGQLRFSLYGEYVLIPYYDRQGYILTVEGRLTGEPAREGDPKYKALCGSGVHLYVHPRFEPGEVVAFCEGAVGAMVAARCGIPVAAIKGMRNYRRPPEGSHDDYSVLPELAGVDFAGKEIVYVPDLDVKPKTREEAFGSVPEACEWLIERQGGRAKVAMLPEGAKDLDEWLLSLPEGDRVPEFMRLLREATNVEEWEPEQYRYSGASGAPCTEASVGQSGEQAVAEDELAPTLEEGAPGEAADRYDEQTASTGSNPGVEKQNADTGGQRPSGRKVYNAEVESTYKKATLLGEHIKIHQPAEADDQQAAAGNVESGPNLPAKAGTDEDRGERSATRGKEDTPTGRRHTPSAGSEEELQDPVSKSRLAASHPAMAFWYEVQAGTGEQLEQKQAEAARRRLREQQRPRRSRAVHLSKWDTGELAIAFVVSFLVGTASLVGAYAARTREGVVGLLGDLFTWPAWWVEVALCLSLGLLAADWLVNARYRIRRRQLAEHVGAPRRGKH